MGRAGVQRSPRRSTADPPVQLEWFRRGEWQAGRMRDSRSTWLESKPLPPAQPAKQKSNLPHPRGSILYFVLIGGEISTQAPFLREALLIDSSSSTIRQRRLHARSMNRSACHVLLIASNDA